MVALLVLFLGSAAGEPDAWRALWTPRTELRAEAPAEFQGSTYAVYATKHFRVHYPLPSAGREPDRQLALHAAARLDGLYEFLARRLALKPATPIRAVLVEGQYGKSKAYPEENAVATGAAGDLVFVLGSFFHELVHLFNFSVPGADQDFWSGELYAQYHDDRLSTLGLEHKARYKKMLAKSPQGFDWTWIGQLDAGYHRLPESERQKLMELGVSVHWFLEDEFGPEKAACFWRARLDREKRASPDPWLACFGQEEPSLRRRWLAYYGL